MWKLKLGIRKLKGSDIEWSNPCGEQTTHFIGCTENPKVKNSCCNHKKIGTTFDAKPIIYVLFANEKETQVRGLLL
jgi:hypothetical protein